MFDRYRITNSHAFKKGFTLIEVVLAIGIFLLSILALVGLLGPTLGSVEDVTQADEVTSVVNTVNAFLMNSPDIATATQSRFETIYRQLRTQGSLTVIVFRQFDTNAPGGDSARERLMVGFGSPGFNSEAIITRDEIASGDNILAAGPIYYAVLTASSVIPENATPSLRSPGPSPYGGFQLDQDFDSYPEGYLAMEVRIFSKSSQYITNLSLGRAHFGSQQPIFTYNMAIVR